MGSMEPYTKGSGIRQRGLLGRIADIHDFTIETLLMLTGYPKLRHCIIGRFIIS